VFLEWWMVDGGWWMVTLFDNKTHKQSRNNENLLTQEIVAGFGWFDSEMCRSTHPWSDHPAHTHTFGRRCRWVQWEKVMILLFYILIMKQKYFLVYFSTQLIIF